MLSVAPKQDYLPYPVTKDWCSRVRDTLDMMPRGAYTRLSEYLRKRLDHKVTSGHLSDVLNGKYQTSDLVGPIHEFLGWSPPLPPTASLDAGELVHGYQRLTAAQREFLDQALETLQGESGDQARKALMEMLKVFRASRQND